MQFPAEWSVMYIIWIAFNSGVAFSFLFPHVPKLKEWYQAWESWMVEMCSAKFILLKGISLKVWFPWLTYSSLRFLIIVHFLQW